MVQPKTNLILNSTQMTMETGKEEIMTVHEWRRIDPDDRSIIERYILDLPVRLGALANELGVKVRLSSLPANCSGFIHRVEGLYEIKINRHESRERQRFTLAHEIAHYLLHRDIIDDSEDGIRDDVLYRSGETDAVEYEANKLAADLVTPIALVKERLNQFQNTISEDMIEFVAKEFGVSKAAMEIRVSA